MNLHSCCNSHTHSRSICHSISCIVSVVSFGIWRVGYCLGSQARPKSFGSFTHTAQSISEYTNNFCPTSNIVVRTNVPVSSWVCVMILFWLETSQWNSLLLAPSWLIAVCDSIYLSLRWNSMRFWSTSTDFMCFTSIDICDWTVSSERHFPLSMSNIKKFRRSCHCFMLSVAGYTLEYRNKL